MKRLALLLLLSVPCFASYSITAVRIIANNAAGTSACSTSDNPCNGWVAEIDMTGAATGGTYAFGLGTNNNPVGAGANPKIVFTVTAPGYSSAGVLGTETEKIYGTLNLREPYPNNAVNDETSSGGTLTVRVALSDYIYSGDTVTVSIASGFYTVSAQSNAAFSGSVTNNSTAAYSATKSLGAWAAPVIYSKISGNFTLEAAVFNRFARNAQEVAAVKFQCSDAHAHMAGPYVVSKMTISNQQFSGQPDANPVIVYAATVDVTSLTQGDQLTCDFWAYPWRGDATAVLTSSGGAIQPSVSLGSLLLLNDKSGTYGQAFAVVDSAGGGLASNATTFVFSTQAGAEAAYNSNHAQSYQANTYAASAIQAYNNANYSRNNPGGGTILVSGLSNPINGTGSGSAGTGQVTYLTITHLSTGSQATAGFNSCTAVTGIQSQLVRFYDLTIAISANAYFGASSTAVNWLDHNAINWTASQPVATGFYVATRNTVSAMSNGFGWNNGQRFFLVRGNTATVAAGLQSDMYAMLGNKGVYPIFQTLSPASDGGIVAFNSGSYVQAIGFWLNGGGPTTLGAAFAQNLIEATGSTDGVGFLNICAPGPSATSVTCSNVIVQHNTNVGERSNTGYAWATSGSAVDDYPQWSERGNIWDGYNVKTDTDSANAANTTPAGNWPLEWSVAQSANLKRYEVGSLHLGGEFVGLNSTYGSAFGFVNCQGYNYGSPANGCGNGGNGNYHLKSNAAGVSYVLAGTAVLPYDLAGQIRNNDGWGSAGVYAQEMIRTKAFGW